MYWKPRSHPLHSMRLRASFASQRRKKSGIASSVLVVKKLYFIFILFVFILIHRVHAKYVALLPCIYKSQDEVELDSWTTATKLREGKLASVWEDFRDMEGRISQSLESLVSDAVST